MRKSFIYAAVGLLGLSALSVSCKNVKPVSVTEYGMPGAPVAVIVEYSEPVSAASVNVDAYKVDGKEIAAVFTTDENPAEKLLAAHMGHHHGHGMHPGCPQGPAPKDGVKPEGPKPEGTPKDGVKPEGPKPEGAPKDGVKPEGPKPEGAPKDGVKPEGPKPQKDLGPMIPESKDGKYVVILLKGHEGHHGMPGMHGMPGGCPKEGMAPGQCPKEGMKEGQCPKEGMKEGQCPKEGMKEGEPCPDCKEGKPCDMPDSLKGECPNCPDAPKDGVKPEGPKHEGAPKDGVKPELNVTQVAAIKTAAGKTVKAWSKAMVAAQPKCEAPKDGAKPQGQPAPKDGVKPEGAPQGQPAPQKPAEKK